ncbi:MAG: hypothetical protein ABL931_06190 [Usitatibacteraceae bacterium]
MQPNPSLLNGLTSLIAFWQFRMACGRNPSLLPKNVDPHLLSQTAVKPFNKAYERTASYPINLVGKIQRKLNLGANSVESLTRGAWRVY